MKAARAEQWDSRAQQRVQRHAGFPMLDVLPEAHPRRFAAWAAGVLFLVTTAGGARGFGQNPPSSPRTPSAAPSGPAIANVPQPGQKQPQAKTPEEAAAYQALLGEQKPDERIHLVEDFLLQYPDSEMREFAYQAGMQAYQAKNDFNHLLIYGELALAENPDNLTALLTLSAAISEMTDRNDSEREEKLADGERYAVHALEVIGKLHKPPGFPDERWAEMRHESESTAHAARGLIALLREDFVKAELELKEAVALARRPDAVVLYRLGLSYSFQKKYEEALEALDRAAALGGIKLNAGGGKTRDLVAEAKEFAAKGLAAAPPAATPATAAGPASSPVP